jgi:hypothetical protein
MPQCQHSGSSPRSGDLHLLPRRSELDPFLGSTACTSFRDAAACTSFPVAAACTPSPAAKDRGGGRLRVLPLFLYVCVHDGGGVLRRRPGGCVRRRPGGGGRGDPYTIFCFQKSSFTESYWDLSAHIHREGDPRVSAKGPSSARVRREPFTESKL